LHTHEICSLQILQNATGVNCAPQALHDSLLYIQL
jgi:hypothetical protein